jgi:hypothetical protein
MLLCCDDGDDGCVTKKAPDEGDTTSHAKPSSLTQRRRRE